jgi:hypothetical protein
LNDLKGRPIIKGEFAVLVSGMDSNDEDDVKD